MKHLLALFFFTSFSIMAFGQNGVFIAFGANGGIGGNIHDSYSHNIYYTSSSVFTYSFDARVGYRFGNILNSVRVFPFSNLVWKIRQKFKPHLM